MKILYRNNKWNGIWDQPKYNEMRSQIKESFTGLVFVEEGHKYFLNGKQMTCVSDVTHLFAEHFDSEQKAVKTYNRNFDNPKSKYYHMTVEQILESWKQISKDACEAGTFTHECGESMFYYMTGQLDKILPDFKDRLTDDGGFVCLYPKEEAAAKFWEDVPECYVPILAETKVYDEELGYSGTFDLLMYYDAELNNKDASKSGLIVWDYKTNKNLEKNFMGKRLLKPFDYLLDMPKSLYGLQLSLYQSCLEKRGFKAIMRSLIWLKSDGDYDKIKLADHVNELRNALKDKELKPSVH